MGLKFYLSAFKYIPYALTHLLKGKDPTPPESFSKAEEKSQKFIAEFYLFAIPTIIAFILNVLLIKIFFR